MTGNFIWYELLTSDADAAQEFYEKVVGWKVQKGTDDGFDYRMWMAPDGGGVGGLMALPEGAAAAGMEPMWLSYIDVPAVDAAVTAIVEDGGKELMPALTMANVGRMAMVADPQGAAFYVMTPEGQGQSTAFAPGKIGHCGWNELHVGEPDVDRAFYIKHFGWKDIRTLEMGPEQNYHIMSAQEGIDDVGMMHNPDVPRSMWLYYFHVEDIDEGKARVEAAGGAVTVGPMAVPDEGWALIARDPQGAMFGLLGHRK